MRTNEDPNIINKTWFITIRNAYEQKVRKTALEVAHSAHSDLKINSELTYPEDNNTDYATQFAMGIVAQLKSTPDTPDLIMKQILGYLPYMDDRRSIECIKLAAMRPKPTLPDAEPIEPVLNQFKRQSEGSEPAAKRQKQRVGQREMAFLQGNEAVLAPRSERSRLESHSKRIRFK